MTAIQFTYTTATPKGEGCGHEHRTPEGAGGCLGRYEGNGGKGRLVLRRTPGDRRRFKPSEIIRVAGWHAGAYEWRGARMVSRDEWELAFHAQRISRLEARVRKGATRLRGPKARKETSS